MNKQTSLLLINLLCLKNVVLEENQDGNFLVISTSPSPSPQENSMLKENLSKIEQQLQFLTTKVNNFLWEQNEQVRKHLEKQITTHDDALKSNSKQIVQLLEEMKEKQVQQDKTLAELSRKLESLEEAMKQQMLSKVEQQKTKVLQEQITTYDGVLKNSSKQIMHLLEETKEKEVQQDKTLAELSKKLEEAVEHQIYPKLESNELLLNQIIERQEETQLRIDQMDEYLLGQFPRDCKEIKFKRSNISGVYGIQPANAPKPFMVWCDLETRGGGWVQVLNRFDGSVDFSRNWTDYKQGFGDLRGELWIGLEHLYQLTSSEQNELLVELSDWKDRKRYAIYSDFEIGDEGEGYKFKKWGTYSGTAGNSMRLLHGQKFSTLDNDQDTASWNCAEVYNGGWWYQGCYQGKLTGKYFNGTVRAEGRGIHWETFASLNVSLKTAKMMIRPIK